MDLATLPTYYYQIGISILIIILFLTGNIFIRKVVRRRALKFDIDKTRVFYIVRFFNFLWSVVMITLLFMVWDISFQGLSIYFASIFTVIGVGFFAQWSILSNITAGVLLFFNHSYKVGNKIKIIDGDNSITGVVTNIQLFYFLIKTESGEIISYPNNLIIQKPVQKIER
jgi:small-conductance mechanosensitive channel